FDSTTGKVLKNAGGSSSSAIQIGADTTNAISPAPVASGQGSQIVIVGGNSTDVAGGKGGRVRIIGGVPTAGNADGGDVIIEGGAGQGSGVRGTVTISNVVDPTNAQDVATKAYADTKQPLDSDLTTIAGL